MLIYKLLFPTEILLSYSRFDLTYDLSEKVTKRWSYTLNQDSFKNEFPRPTKYFYDPKLPKEYQQKSLWSYGKGYDRGHLVRSYDMSGTFESRHECNYITNILPQKSTFNRGVWLNIEKKVSDLAMTNKLNVTGGVIFNDTSNDHFVESHGVKTPDFWWKIVVVNSNETLAWFIPNKENLKTESYYRLSVADLKKEIDL